MKKIKSVCIECEKEFNRVEGNHNETFDEKNLCLSCRTPQEGVTLKKIGENLN